MRILGIIWLDDIVDKLVPFQHDYDACHCEERSDEAIPSCAKQSVSHENVGIASLRSQ